MEPLQTRTVASESLLKHWVEPLLLLYAMYLRLNVVLTVVPCCS